MDERLATNLTGAAAFAAGSWQAGMLRGASMRSVNVKGYLDSRPINGNSKLSPKTAYLYELYQKDGTFLKYGITQNSNVAKRYTRAFMKGKRIFSTNSGPRANMLKLERTKVELAPGILNNEAWAKAAKAAGRLRTK